MRSTHGVNCTGSCSWKVYVKDGIITWESQQTDYPSNGPDAPEYEPRGCPRGASFSWYTYSPIRIKYPYVCGVLVEMYREAKAQTGDPVDAWASVVEDPEKARRYKAARGKGGLVRSSWPEVAEIMAAASSPPLGELDIDAWERSLNVRGFIYCLAAALPAMRKRGGGRIVVVGVEDVQDPLLRAWRAAVRTILDEVSREFSSDGIHTAEVRLDVRQARNPEECSDTIVRALKDPASPDH